MQGISVRCVIIIDLVFKNVIDRALWRRGKGKMFCSPSQHLSFHLYPGRRGEVKAMVLCQEKSKRINIIKKMSF